MQTHHLIIKGKVQGVFFRATAKKMATSLGVVGWVKNTKEGDVEMMVSGTDESLQAFEQWCKTGPTQAQVEDIIIRPVAHLTFEDFKILK